MGECLENKQYIIIQDNNGKYKTRKDHLINGVIPTIESSLNKNEHFIIKANEIHNNKYDYSKINYISAHKKLTIICPIHGQFSQTANSHLLKSGCPKCGDKRCSFHHSINPSGWTRTNWKEKSKNSKSFQGFKTYIIKCWNENETFYKIGRTFVPIKRRFCNFPYNYEIIKIFEGEAEEMYDLETKLKHINKDKKYFPTIKFGGDKECYRDLVKIKEYEIFI
jgi:hypothetical protein